ncbi:MAG: hypothetical protein JJW00_06945 [Sulfurimonas sp.]|nr:hypothetical protein [Sulfurimonas sp.]
MRTLLILLISINLYATVKQNMLTLYEDKKYQKACNIGFNNLKQYKKDEKFILVYAFSCLNSDQIDRLAIPITLLNFSPESRKNSAYFSVILMQKKLLYHALIDNYNLSSLNLPTTKYVLSKVFDLYAKLGQHESKDFYIFKDEDDKEFTYKLYLLKDAGTEKIVIEELYDTITIKRHVYW